MLAARAGAEHVCRALLRGAARMLGCGRIVDAACCTPRCGRRNTGVKSFRYYWRAALLAFRLARREPQLLRLLAEACLKSPDAAALLRQEDCSGRRPLDYFLCAQHALDQDRALPPPPLLLRCARLAPGGKYSLGLARDCRGTVCGSTRSTVSC